MSPDLAYILVLAFRMIVAAAFVVSASFITEHSGPAIGALVATLPISAGPSYVFLALDHDSAFVAQGALSSLPINAATIFLGLTYTLLAQRHNLFISYGAAAAVWSGILLNVVAFAICTPLMHRYRHAKMPPVARRWYDVPLRASLVAILVAA